MNLYELKRPKAPTRERILNRLGKLGKYVKIYTEDELCKKLYSIGENIAVMKKVLDLVKASKAEVKEKKEPLKEGVRMTLYGITEEGRFAVGIERLWETREPESSLKNMFEPLLSRKGRERLRKYVQDKTSLSPDFLGVVLDDYFKRRESVNKFKGEMEKWKRIAKAKELYGMYRALEIKLNELQNLERSMLSEPTIAEYIPEEYRSS